MLESGAAERSDEKHSRAQKFDRDVYLDGRIRDHGKELTLGTKDKSYQQVFTMSSTLVMHCGAFLLSWTIGSIRFSTFMMPAPAWLIWLRWQERSTVPVSARLRKRNAIVQEAADGRSQQKASLLLSLWQKDKQQALAIFVAVPEGREKKVCCDIQSFDSRSCARGLFGHNQTCFFTMECAGGLFQLTETWSKSRVVSVWPTGLSA